MRSSSQHLFQPLIVWVRQVQFRTICIMWVISSRVFISGSAYTALYLCCSPACCSVRGKVLSRFLWPKSTASFVLDSSWSPGSEGCGSCSGGLGKFDQNSVSLFQPGGCWQFMGGGVFLTEDCFVPIQECQPDFMCELWHLLVKGIAPICCWKGRTQQTFRAFDYYNRVEGMDAHPTQV